MRLPSDYDFMYQEKEIEQIQKILNNIIEDNKKTYKKEAILTTVPIIISIITSIFAILFKIIPIWIYILIGVLVILFPFIPTIKDFFLSLPRKQKSNKINKDEQVDLFYNQIINNVMIAKKYYDLSKKKSIIEKNLFISEAQYYVEKTLNQIKNIDACYVTSKKNTSFFDDDKKIKGEDMVLVFSLIESFIYEIFDDANYREKLKKQIDNKKQECLKRSDYENKENITN